MENIIIAAHKNVLQSCDNEANEIQEHTMQNVIR